MRAPLSPLTLVLSLAVWACVRALAGETSDTSQVYHADLFGGLFVGLLGGFIRNLLGNDPGNTGATVARAIVNLQDGLSSVAGGMQRFVGETRGWLSGLVGVFKTFKESALIPLLRWLREKIVWLKEWLKRMLGPTIEFLLKVRKKLLELYAKYVRPVLDMIEIARFFLRTLERLGVKWAGELERRLGQAETAITTNFQILLKGVNDLIDGFRSIVTLDLLFQRIPFLRTLVRDALYLNRVWWHINLDNVARPDPDGSDRGELEKRPIQDDIGELRQFMQTGGGPKAGIIRELRLIALTAARGAEK